MARILPPNAQIIPDSAKCAFKGVIFDVYQWQQELYDGSFATFEMLKRPDTVVVIAVNGDKIVYISDEQPPNRFRVSFPGGRVDPGEEWEEAAKREMVEETGMSFKNWRLIDVAQPIVKIEWFVAYYLAWDIDSEIEPNPGAGEIVKVKLGSFEEAINEISTDPPGFLPKVLKNVKVLNELLNIETFNGTTNSK